VKQRDMPAGRATATGKAADRDWRRIEPGGKEHRDYQWQESMCSRPKKCMTIFGKPPKGETPHTRPIFPQDKNQDVRHPSRWTSGFLNRTYCAYNRSYFNDLESFPPLQSAARPPAPMLTPDPPPGVPDVQTRADRPATAPAGQGRRPRPYLEAGGPLERPATRERPQTSRAVPGYTGFVPRSERTPNARECQGVQRPVPFNTAVRPHFVER